MSTVKQVIVIRKDLKMRRGKECSQSAHASLAVILDEMKYSPSYKTGTYIVPAVKTLIMDDDLEAWINGSFTKITCVVNSEEELLDLYTKAKNVGLRASLIMDSGKTEFNGVPTNTVIAIGPNKSELIDTITGHLKLY